MQKLYFPIAKYTNFDYIFSPKYINFVLAVQADGNFLRESVGFPANISKAPFFLWTELPFMVSPGHLLSLQSFL